MTFLTVYYVWHIYLDNPIIRIIIIFGHNKYQLTLKLTHMINFVIAISNKIKISKNKAKVWKGTMCMCTTIWYFVEYIYDKMTTTSQIIAIIIIIIIVIINNRNNATKINENDEKTHLPDTRMNIEKLKLAHYIDNE